MQLLSRFFATIHRSLTDVSFYREALKGRLRSGIGYLAALFYMLWILQIGFFAATVVPYIPQAQAFLERHLTIAQSTFPADLEIMIDGGTLSTNSANPVVVPLPDVWQQALTEGDEPFPFSSLAVIDTTASVEDYADKGGMVLLTQSSMIFADKDNGLRVMPFSEFELPPGFTVDKAMVDELAGGVRPMLASVQPLLWGIFAFSVLLLPLLLTGLSLVGRMLWLLLPVLLLWTFVRARGMRMQYGDIYHLSLYGLTPVILVSTASSLVHFPFGMWLSLGVFLAFMGYVLTQLPAAKKRSAA